MMMTIDEAIKHCLEVAEKNEKIADTFEYSLKTKSDCKKCASEHRQLAEWLRELQALRRGATRIYDAIKYSHAKYEPNLDCYAECLSLLMQDIDYDNFPYGGES